MTTWLMILVEEVQVPRREKGEENGKWKKHQRSLHIIKASTAIKGPSYHLDPLLCPLIRWLSDPRGVSLLNLREPD
jgi:hypothetical protein